MRIGLLTYHRSINYGSVLQAWATQDYLTQRGYDIEIIDYIPKAYDKLYGVLLPNNSIGNIVRNIVRVPLIPKIKKQIQYFSDFRNNHLRLSQDTYDNTDSCSSLDTHYDCFICGSDQIWNIRAIDCDDFFFLPGVRKKKIAYAVSINTTDFTEPRCTEELKRWIEDFDYISCREKAGAERIRAFIGNSKPVETMLDPTLLHHKKDYYSICNPPLIKGDYIFLYNVWGGKDSYDFVKEISKSSGMPVYSLLLVKNCITMVRIETKGVHIIKNDVRPEDYLSLIRYAALVVTNSFHGTAFSLIFEKPFYCVSERKKDGSTKKDERLIGILSQFDLLERYISVSDMKDIICCTNELDYSQITPYRMKLADICANKLVTQLERL